MGRCVDGDGRVGGYGDGCVVGFEVVGKYDCRFGFGWGVRVLVGVGGSS